MMTRLLSLALMLVAVLAVLAVQNVAAFGADKAPDGKIYELRIYKANPGKLEALHARFRDHTNKIFAKHGIEIVGYWTPMEGEDAKDTLIYLVAFPSVEAQKKAWDAFKADPVWKKVKADSEREGVLVREVQSKNLKATDYSPIR
jgi:hypothetical protein